MRIGPFLEGEAFDQELVDAMSKALVDACQVVGLTPMYDAPTRLLAMRIIKKAREGVRDPEGLKAAALKGLGAG